MNSWLASICWPVRKASAREMDMASVSANSVMTTVTEAKLPPDVEAETRADSGGRLEGKPPTVRDGPRLWPGS